MEFLTTSEWQALALAVALLLLAGAWHLGGILAIRSLLHRLRTRNSFAVLLVFWGLAMLHVSEIVISAIVYGIAIHWLGLGSVSSGYGDSAGGLLYLAGITFATLGYTEQVVAGPLRLMTMMLSLAGFMLITWSATYVYSVWGDFYRRDAGKDREDE